MGQLLLQIFLGLVFLLFGLAGIDLTVQSYKDLRTAISSRTWHQVEAVVTNHKVYTYETGGGDKTPRRTRYRYSVMYTYGVEQQTFEGSGFDRYDFVAWKYANRASTEDYPVGKAVQIHYDPDNPETSMSKTPSDWITERLMDLFLGFGFMSIGLITGLTILFSNLAIPDSLAGAFLTIGVVIVTIPFWCFMLLIVVRILTDCFKEVRNRRLPRPGIGFFIVLILFGFVSTQLVGWLVSLAGLVLIGSAPGKGCYQPNFQEKRWISIPCPPPPPPREPI